jgi:hypothetical protein
MPTDDPPDGDGRRRPRLRRHLLDLTPLRVSRDYRLLWTGSFVSAFGSQFARVGLYVQVFALTGSPAAVGLLGLSGLVKRGGHCRRRFVHDARDRRSVIGTQVGHCSWRGAGRERARAGATDRDPALANALTYAGRHQHAGAQARCAWSATN